MGIKTTLTITCDRCQPPSARLERIRLAAYAAVLASESSHDHVQKHTRYGELYPAPGTIPGGYPEYPDQLRGGVLTVVMNLVNVRVHGPTRAAGVVWPSRGSARLRARAGRCPPASPPARRQAPMTGGHAGPFRVSVCAARTLNATGESWVTLSLR